LPHLPTYNGEFQLLNSPGLLPLNSLGVKLASNLLPMTVRILNKRKSRKRKYLRRPLINRKRKRLTLLPLLLKKKLLPKNSLLSQQYQKNLQILMNKKANRKKNLQILMKKKANQKKVQRKKRRTKKYSLR